MSLLCVLNKFLKLQFLFQLESRTSSCYRDALQVSNVRHPLHVRRSQFHQTKRRETSRRYLHLKDQRQCIGQVKPCGFWVVVNIFFLGCCILSSPISQPPSCRRDRQLSLLLSSRCATFTEIYENRTIASIVRVTTYFASYVRLTGSHHLSILVGDSSKMERLYGMYLERCQSVSKQSCISLMESECRFQYPSLANPRKQRTANEKQC